jgi:HSP20 family protein
MEVPGAKSPQIEISVVGNQLAVKVERPDLAQQGVAFHRRERAVGAFSRVLQLPVEVDAERVQADLRNGVLTVTLPKAAAARPRKIQVTAAQ